MSDEPEKRDKQAQDRPTSRWWAPVGRVANGLPRTSPGPAVLWRLKAEALGAGTERRVVASTATGGDDRRRTRQTAWRLAA